MSIKRAKKKNWILISILAIVIVVVTAVFLMWPKTTSYESAVASIGDITTYYSFPGNVETKNRQTVMSEKVMQISAIKFKEGDTVKEGDVLIETSTGDEIESKIDGVVTNVNIEENAQVMAGVKLMEIVDNNNLEIKVKVDEYDITALTAGKETTINIVAIDKELTGKVASMSVEGQTVNGVTYFTATIDLAKNSDVKIGMSAEVKLISEQVTGVVTLPMTAIQFDENNNPYVLKEDDNGTAVKTEITTGINDGTTVQIKNGVSNNEAVLYTKSTTSTGMGFRAGMNRSTSSGGDN
ncbi:MAG: HlyD family efflux transporter periplasmic adaptor subunit [Herbinix sp.]|nr:HlyD family efflux transporter periplasmic adaptor subunit [Herbinix sp.]